MWFKETSFNKVVRSKEALILGLLIGVICGVLLMINVTIQVKEGDWIVAIKLCEKKENVSTIHFSYMGTVKKVTCKDKQTFDNF